MNSKFTTIVRILLGIILIISGVNKLYPLFPNPAKDFVESFGQVFYILQIVAILEISVAVMLFTKKWVAFALILLAPISINILLFHLYLNLPGLPMALVVAILNGILIYKHWKLYKPLFN